MVKVGVQTKGILPEMGIEDGVAIIARQDLRWLILILIHF